MNLNGLFKSFLLLLYVTKEYHEEQRNRQINKNGLPIVTRGAETMILTKGEEEKLRSYEENLRLKESSGRNLPKTDELRGLGKIERRGHCESYKDTDAAVLRPHKKDGRRKNNEQSDRL